MKSKPVNNLEDLQLVDNIKKDKKKGFIFNKSLIYVIYFLFRKCCTCRLYCKI